MFTCQLYSYDTFYDDFGGLIAQQVDAGILASSDASSVGGKLPGDDFYYAL